MSNSHDSDDDSLAPVELIADDAVLDELSRAFAADGDGFDDPGPEPEPQSQPQSQPLSESDSLSEPVSLSRETISIGGDDDLPDVAYLDDELERDSSGSKPVFIDDDGESDAVSPSEASTRGIEPRIRQRRIGVTRSKHRRRLWWLALAATVIVVAIGVLAVLGSSMFAVDEVSVTGAVYADQAALDAVVDDLSGTAVLLVDTAKVEAQLEAIPWVEDARVSTSFPNSASIEIRERTPVAAMMGADGLARVIDVDGRVLAAVDGQPVALVWIAGPDTLDVAPGQFASIGYSSAASLVTKLTPDIRSRVESMLVTADGSDLVIVLTSDRGPVEVRFGTALGENAQIEKLVRLQRTLDDVGTKPVTVIDVSTSEVTVR
ncbi:MAG TPA: FtsQ-type POTRA domain-containing protein [Ilumatobacteraceae bacterium]|nr:FtsQ-type POTRA domain-containing protein [Ilumatobacteraceae bacterium]